MPFKFNMRQMLFWGMTLLLFVAVYQNMKSAGGVKQIPYSEFKRELKSGTVTDLVVGQDQIKGKFASQSGEVSFRTVAMADPELISDLESAGVRNYEGAADRSWVTSLLLNLGWIAVFVFLWWFLFFRQAQMGGKQAMSFGKSRARQQDVKKTKVSFADVAGCDETKEELKDIVDYLKNPKKYRQLGGKLPKGVLLYGPPGTGKTLLARAIAGEAGVPFFTSSGSEFVEMFVGVGASRVRDLFERAKRNPPAIVFIDELDAVGRSRFAGIGGGHDEREQTLNQMLVELDGFNGNEGIILIGATNRPDVLDNALLRPGRFDRRIYVPVPDIKGRREILEVHAKKVRMAEKVDFELVARHTPGFVGADLSNVVNEAAILAAKKEKSSVEQGDMEEAIEKMIAGPQRRTRFISDKERRIVAYHEAGHALVARFLPGCDPVHKISIIPRGPALGYTLQLPLEDKYLTSSTEILNKLCVLLAGRVAEEIVFEDITTGAQDDLSKVSSYVHKMVLEYGMSSKIGPISLKKDEGEVFLGRDIVRPPGYSNETAKNVDDEIMRIVAECHEKTRSILLKSRASLEALADRLLEKEVVDSAEMEEVVAASSPAEQHGPAA